MVRLRRRIITQAHPIGITDQTTTGSAGGLLLADMDKSPLDHYFLAIQGVLIHHEIPSAVESAVKG